MRRKRRARIGQPPGFVALDSRAGLVGFAVPGVGELVGCRGAIFSGTFDLATGPPGICAQGPSTQVPGYIGYDLAAPAAITGDYTTFLYASAVAPEVGVGTHSFEATGLSGDFFSIRGSAAYVSMDGNGTSDVAGDYTTPTLFIGVRRGNQIHFFIRGRLVATATTGTRTGTITGITFGRNRIGNANPVRTHGYAMGVLARGLSDAEIAALENSPWGLLPTRSSPVPVSAGGGGTPVTATTSLGAAIQAARSATASVGAAIQTGRTVTTSVGAAIREAKAASASIGTALQLARTAQASADAAIQAATSASSSVDGVVQVPSIVAASVDAAIQAGHSASTDINAYIQAGGIITADLGAAISASVSATATVNAFIQAGTSASTSLSAAVQESRSAQASLGAAIAAATALQVDLSAAIAVTRTVVAATSAAVLAARARTASLNAFVDDGTTALSLEERLWAALSGVFDGAMWPDVAPVRPVGGRPYLVYQQVAGQPINTLCGAGGNKENAVVSFLVAAPTRLQANSLLRQVKEAVTGVAFKAVDLGNFTANYDADTKNFLSQQEFSFWFET